MDSASTPVLRRRLDNVASTQSPTEATTEPNGSSIQNRNGVETEPLLTTGEKIGAVIGGSVTFLIAIYFIVLFVQARQFLKRQEEQRKRTKYYKKERRRRKKTSISGWKRYTERTEKERRLMEINGQEDSTFHSTMDEYSNYGHDSGGECSKPSTIDIEMSTAYIRSDDGHSEDVSTGKSATSKASSHKWAEKTHLFTRLVLKGLGSNEPNDDEDENTTSHYVQHQDEIEDDGESINTTISSPFHPSPTPRIENARSEPVNTNTTIYVLQHEVTMAREEVQEQIPDPKSILSHVIAVDDRPFDCQHDDQPFDCVE